MANGDRPRVVIAGGGLAGLAAAVALEGRGLDLTLLESRPRLGGRAGSFPDPATGELVDNCQHVSMACCTNLADFCGRVGTRDLFRRVDAIRFLGLKGESSTLRGGFLPAPFHLTGSFLRANYLSIPDRFRVARGLLALRWGRSKPSEPMADWLRRHGQSERAIEHYWSTVLVSALNERVEQMDVGHARKVFVEGFLRSRRGYEMEVPTVPLGEIYGTRLESWLRSRDVDLRLKTGTRGVDLDETGRVAGIRLRTGESVPADYVVAAVPFDRIRRVLGEPLTGRIKGLSALDRFAASPITGIHLWYDREVCPVDHAVTVGRAIHWVFNHSALSGRTAPGGSGQYLQLVVSASYDLLDKTNEEVRDLAIEDLAALWPAAREAKLVRWRVVTEHGATFAVRPGIDAFRPTQRTEVPGLFLAGDWTATGWPATMEGAVRSGYRAAEGILEDLGRPEVMIRPDLPGGRLARFLLGPART